MCFYRVFSRRGHFLSLTGLYFLLDNLLTSFDLRQPLQMILLNSTRTHTHTHRKINKYSKNLRTVHLKPPPSEPEGGHMEGHHVESSGAL